MTVYLDTNILVRHFTGDPPEQARRATVFLASASDLHLSDVVAAEVVDVLESFYERPPEEIAALLRATIAFASIAVSDHDRLLRALEIYELQRIDFTDSYLAACVEIEGADGVGTFDHDLDRVDSVLRIEPPERSS